MAANKCKSCGSSEIEEDPARGDAVCVNCGSVLESNLIVSEVQFQESANGTNSTIGQFVSSESKGGGCGNFGNSFHMGMGSESREITLRKAKQGITTLCNQLNLTQHCIETACNFFKMALTRQLTRGRRNTHVFASCVYITCRTLGTSHLLIDISDAVQICCYELGRTYLRISQALCITIPSVDPCIYILRFANKLELGDKTQQVTTTALRLVKRMKRDSLHSGRRPSGLCGAALLMAARLHDFSRNEADIVKIVKVHESTLRKRLFEFGDTPSSALTLEEFMTVDLEEEQDPPAFKTARKKDKERLMKIHEDGYNQITDMQKEIDRMLQESSKTKRTRKSKDTEKEDEDTNAFIEDSTLGVIKHCLDDDPDDPEEEPVVEELGPDLVSLGLATTVGETTDTPAVQTTEEILLDGLDEEEIDSYIMSEDEAKHKDGVWNKINATYLEEQKAKQERMAKEKEEGKTEKKKRRYVSRKKQIGPSNSAHEAIEKMLQEKRLSTKINYDALKSLNIKNDTKTEVTPAPTETFAVPALPQKRKITAAISEETPCKRISKPKETKKTISTVPVEKKPTETTTKSEEPYDLVEIKNTGREEVEEVDEFEEEEQPTTSTEVGVFQMLRDYRGDGDGDEFGGYGGFENDYDEDY